MKIDFKIRGFKDGEEVTKNYFKGEKYLLAKILSVDFYTVNKDIYRLPSLVVEWIEEIIT